MKINADLSRRALVNSHELPWINSPMVGVQRRMLERDGDEVARATSLVRYAPNSYFDAHTHDAGEEFLVLEGVFSDEMGDFPAGMYLRNPPGSNHKPFTKDGCIIMVKLRQFEAGDNSFVRINSLQNDAYIKESNVEALTLHKFKNEEVSLICLQANATITQIYNNGEELYVVSGSLLDEKGNYNDGTWLRNPGDGCHIRTATTDTVFYYKTGHLGINQK